MAIRGKNKERERTAAGKTDSGSRRESVPVESEEQVPVNDTARHRKAEDSAEGAQGSAESTSGDEQSDQSDLAAELTQWKDKFLRAKADAQNALRRAATEREEAVRYGNARLLRSLLDVVDDLDRTLEAAEKSKDADALSEGVRLIRDKMQSLLSAEHVKPIEATGQPFDPQRHEAMMQQPSADQPVGTVLQQVQRGYTHHDRVLRPAKVIIAVSPPDSDREGEGRES